MWSKVKISLRWYQPVEGRWVRLGNFLVFRGIRLWFDLSYGLVVLCEIFPDCVLFYWLVYTGKLLVTNALEGAMVES
jgi:hypothetical protein